MYAANDLTYEALTAYSGSINKEIVLINEIGDNLDLFIPITLDDLLISLKLVGKIKAFSLPFGEHGGEGKGELGFD